LYPTWLVEEAAQRYEERLREAEAERLANALRRQPRPGQHAPAMLRRSLFSLLRQTQQVATRWRTITATRILPEA
jgi:hypothetical protein